MRDILSQSLKILLPPLVGILLLLFAIWKAYYAEISKVMVDLEIGMLKIPMEEGQRKYAIVGLAGFALLFFTAIRDYSAIMPDKLTLDISFSLERIETIISKYRKASQVEGKVPDDWQERARALQDKMLSKIAEHAKLKPDFAGKSRASGRGLTTFKVSKNNWSSQSYKVEEVDGLLEMRVPVVTDRKAGTSEFVVKTFSTLLKTDRRIFSVDYKKMLHSWHFFVGPLLRQSFYAGAIEEIVIFDTLALTRVRYFPFIAIEETLYLVEDAGQWVPVAYSIYDQ